ncbi:PDZ and LIM domain protein 2 [Kryptolebias marmoratus]|uniref:PDZ and LIM domain protein 2 n=1 Tax=Kryptolebias marmoratus TaxID=37003 RepID=A0A3Q2ZTA7_KRYMA|nr:PDZ and LIM domain protein 2 [Kryptolebias marmoratus]XP_017272845.1 PDZ and LIM domain protein 2 [Kryptolebias marmoratus]
MALTVDMIGPSPYGFRIYGGRDFKKALVITKVNPGSKAEQANLQAGDIIVEINKEDTAEMLNAEAQNKIKNSKTNLSLSILRVEPPSCDQANGINTPEQLTGRFQEAVIVSQDENQNYKRPSSSPPSGMDRKDKQTSNVNQSNQSKTWETDEYGGKRIQENSYFRRSELPPANGSPIKIHEPLNLRDRNSYEFSNEEFLAESEVAKMMQENKESGAPPRQSSTFKVLQEALETDEKEAASRFPGKLSPNPPKGSTSVGGVTKFHTCERCNNSISTQAVRIGDNRYRHPECYTCNDCGLNLKMRGHFWVGDVMYCEKHAKERYQGPFRSQLP